MPTELKYKLLLEALEHLNTILAILGVVGSAVVGFVAYYWKPRVPDFILKSQAVTVFMETARRIMRAVAAKMMDRANEIKAEYEADVKAANGAPDLIKAAEEKRDKALRGLSDEAVAEGRKQLEGCIPSWMLDATSRLYHILEEVLPEVRSTFSKRN